MGLAVAVDERLREMDWGDWEGRTLGELRSEFGSEMAENEARGLDFRPPNGESPRMVQQRLIPWLHAVTAARQDIGAVTHKGVIRALIGLATGWDFLGRPPARLHQGEAQSIVIDDAGELHLEDSRIALTGQPS